MSDAIANTVAPATGTGGEGARLAPVAVVGAGSIGAAFALLYAQAGLTVRLYDALPEALERARMHMCSNLDALREAGLSELAPSALLERVQQVSTLEAALADVQWVQECAPEQLALKRELFAQLDALAPPEAVLASASSAIPMSRIAADLPGAARCLIAHPGNPPYLLRVIELVPAPFTDPQVVARAEAFSHRVGLEPVLVRRELEGFVFNRLQGAVLREAYCLVRDGVATVDDIDTLMRLGLGLRWSVIGPFETVDLNTRGGIAAHAEKLGPAYARMGAERGQNDPWTPELVAEVEAARRAQLPLSAWAQRVAWRDRALMQRLAHPLPPDPGPQAPQAGGDASDAGPESPRSGR